MLMVLIRGLAFCSFGVIFYKKQSFIHPPLSFLPNTLSKNQGLLALSLMTVASSREEQMSLSK